MASLPTPFGEIVGYVNLNTGAAQAEPFAGAETIAPAALPDGRLWFELTGDLVTGDLVTGVQVPLFRWTGPRSGDVEIHGTLTTPELGPPVYFYVWEPTPVIWGQWAEAAGETSTDFEPLVDPPPLPVDTFFLYPPGTSPTFLARTTIDNFTVTGGDAPPPPPRDIDIHAGPLRAGWGTEPVRGNPTSAGQLTCSPLRAGATRSRYSAGPTYLED